MEYIQNMLNYDHSHTKLSNEFLVIQTHQDFFMYSLSFILGKLFLE